MEKFNTYGGILSVRFLYKLFLIMRITLILFFAATLTTLASLSYAQSARVSLNMRNVAVKDALRAIENKSEFFFIYNNELIDVNRKVNVNVTDQRIDEILAMLFAEQDIDVAVIDRKIVLAPSDIAAAIQQQRGISGKISDRSGYPLPGVTVVIKGTTTGTVTDNQGNYSIGNLPMGATLVVSFVGMQSQELMVGDQTVLNITMVEETFGIEEVVAIGYGVQKKENLTGAVSVIKMEEVLGERPVINVMNALQGSIPGLVITGGSSPSQQKSFNIRGITSINGGGPLILVDNVPAQIDLINPEDIETVTVLKDASSAAIYGARAAFGVILITTKKAVKNEKLKFNYNNNFGFSYSINQPKQAPALDMLAAYKDAQFLGGVYFANQNVDLWMKYLTEYRQDPSKFNVTENGIYIPTDNNPGKVRYYLHENDLYGNMLDPYGFQQSHNLSAMGGSDRITYRISMGYTDNQGILITDKDSYNRVTVSSYVSADLTDWFNQSFDIRFAKSTNSMPYSGNNGNIYGLRLANLNPEGEMDFNGEMLPINTPRNFILNSYPDITLNENPRVFSRTSIRPLKGLEAIFEYTFDKNITDGKEYNAPFWFTSIQTNKNRSMATSQYWHSKSSADFNSLNLYATYTKSIKDQHNFKVMGGFSQESRYFEQLSANRKEMINEAMPSLTGAIGETLATDLFREYAIRSGFYRFNYDFRGKYLLEANGRYDGSSKFPSTNRFGFFPSFSAGWKLAEEGFMNWSDGWLQDLKIRGSWGEIGNQAISEYGFTPIMSSYLAPWIDRSISKQPTTLGTPAMIRTNFTWERVETTNVGVDVSMFGNKLQSTFDWYIRDTKGMLAPGMEFPAVVGAAAPLQNTADLRTKGWELAVNYTERIGKIEYSVGFNLFDSRTHVTKYNNEIGLFNTIGNIGNGRYREGMEIGEIWGYVSDGYYTADDFVNTSSWQLKEGVPSIRGVQVRPGDIKFKNLNDREGSVNEIDPGNNTVGNPGDQTIIGNTASRYQYGTNAGLKWNGFDLSIFFQGTAKRDAWVSDDLRWAFNSGQFGTIFDNQMDYWKPKDPVNGDWTPVNPDAAWHRIYGEKGNAGSNQRIQTKYLLDASYIRLKNLTLGYTVPKNIIQKTGLTNSKIFISAENVATWTKLPRGYDPERLSWQYPFYRTISMGVNLTL
jgi:TonB-linked SusC/RagA family outer membrane protein